MARFPPYSEAVNFSYVNSIVKSINLHDIGGMWFFENGEQKMLRNSFFSGAWRVFIKREYAGNSDKGALGLFDILLILHVILLV